jgi:hypothetical protein
MIYVENRFFMLAGVLAMLLVMACPAPVEPEIQAAGYAIAVKNAKNGTVSADREAAKPGEVITLTIAPDAGYELASIRAAGDGDITLTGTGKFRKFTMPAQDVTVTAAFRAESGEPTEPTEPTEPAELYEITIVQPANGVIECGRTSAAAGAEVTLTLLPQDEQYRYRAGSLAIEPELELTDAGDGVWTFTMPEESVSVTAEFEEIPAHAITLAQAENGSFSITGVETDGPYEGRAREGASITVTAIPDPGYKMTDNGLCVTPADAVVFARVEGQLSWTFDMVDADLEISVEFAELGLREIYRGGARRGITAGELSDDKKYYEGSVDMEADEPGRNGNQRVIKITHAVNSNGNAAQQSFGLFSDTEIDLETVAALSFWARANKSLNIRYVGFGGADPDKRVVYTGENYNQSIPVGVEWRRYVIPVPAARTGQNAARVFLFNASIAIGNYVCIDDIEFIESGVALTEITMPAANNGLFYGATDAAKILKGVPLKLTYACDDGTVVTLQNAHNSHTLKYNLAPWLIPFVGVGGNVTFSDGVIIPEKGKSSAISLSVNIPGARGNSMTAHIIDGLLLDDFEDIEGAGNVPIPGTPAEGTGYLWHTSGGSPVVTAREYFTVEHKEIHRGLRAGSWRPNASASSKTRGGRNFGAKDAADYQTLTFWIKVTVGGGNTVPQKNTVFTFELRNGGTLTNKTSGSFYARQFTYDTDNADGWQEVTMPLADFVELGLDSAAITGYAFGVVDNQGSALRIMLDDVSLLP